MNVASLCARALLVAVFASAALAPAGAAHAQGGEAQAQGGEAQAQGGEAGDPGSWRGGSEPLPAGVERQTFAYGAHPRQRLDVYRPPDSVRAAEATPSGAPILVMVHGGGWQIGNKRAPGVVGAKATHWVSRGWILVSVGYRLQPDAPPSAQGEDVARALALVTRRARDWGGDPARVVLMGHSAGAHLAALVAADPAAAERLGARRPVAAVLLDGAALDVEAMLQRPHPRLYDRAFGDDPAEWRAVSPTARLASGSVPMLAVCSSLRAAACPEAEVFAARVRALGGIAEVRPQPLTHMAINRELGTAGPYTDAVDAFIARAFVAPPPR